MQDLTLISIPPYRMTLAKLKELNTQLQDLVDKDFIWPSLFSKNWFEVRSSIYWDFEILRWISNETLIIVLNCILLRWKYEIWEWTRSDFRIFEVFIGINIFGISPNGFCSWSYSCGELVLWCIRRYSRILVWTWWVFLS